MNRLVDQATAAYYAGDYNLCITHFNSVLSACHQGDKSPRVVFLHSNRCQAWIALGQWDNAKVDAERTVLLLPSFVKGHYQVGLCEEQEGHLGEAAAAYCAALQHIASIQKSRRQNTTAFLLAKLLRLACEDNSLWAKFDLGLTLAAWDRFELLRWLLRLNDWVAVDLFVRRLHEHEQLTLDQLLLALSSDNSSENDVKDGTNAVLADSLTSAMEFALRSGNLVPLQLLLRYSCQAANSKDTSDAANNSLLHQICILHNDDKDGMDENKSHIIEPAFMVDWLLTQGLNCSGTNREGKKPADLLKEQNSVWKNLQSSSSADLVKDLSYMESQEIDNFLLSQFCTLRKLNAVDLIEKIPGLSQESIDAIKTSTENKKRNTAWKALVKGVQCYSQGLLELSLALQDVAPVQSKLVLLVYSNRCAQRLWNVCPDLLSIYRNWSVLMQVGDVKDIVTAMKTIPQSLRSLILDSSSAPDLQRTILLILMHHLQGENEVKDFVQALESTGNMKISEMIDERTALLKEKLSQDAVISFKSLKESPFTTFEEIPCETAYSKHKRRKASSRASRSSKQNELDCSVPEPLKDFELEVANEVASCGSAAIYMPLLASHVGVSAAIVQRHIWSMNDLEEDPKENCSQRAPVHSQKSNSRSKSCEAPSRNVSALKMVELNQGAASVHSSPRKRKKSGRNMTDDHDEYVVGRHVANMEAPVSVKGKEVSRPSPSKSPRRGRHLSESQRGGDYSPSPCREGRRGRKGQSPGPSEGHQKQGKSQGTKQVEEEKVEVESRSRAKTSKSENVNQDEAGAICSEKSVSVATGNAKNYSILVQVAQWEEVHEVTKSLCSYLPHLNIASHGVNKSAKVGLLRLLESSDVVVTTIKTTRNCLGAKSLSLSDLTLIVTLNLHGNDLENFFGMAEARGVPSIRSICVISEMMSATEDMDSKRRTLDQLNCSSLVFNKKCRLPLYQHVNSSLKFFLLAMDSENIKEDLDSHFAECYGSQDNVIAIILGAQEDLRGLITTVVKNSLPVESNVIDLDPDDLESRSKVKVNSKSGCNLVFSDTTVDPTKITEMFPEANFLLVQSGNSIEVVYGGRSTNFVPIFLTYNALIV